MTTQSETPRTPLLRRLHARLDSDYELRRMYSLARGLRMMDAPEETEQLLLDSVCEIEALTAANADLTAQLAEARRDAGRLDWLCKQMVTFENQSLLIIHPSDLRAAIDIAMQDESDENYDCPIHGKQDSPDCARC